MIGPLNLAAFHKQVSSEAFGAIASGHLRKIFTSSQQCNFSLLRDLAVHLTPQNPQLRRLRRNQAVLEKANFSHEISCTEGFFMRVLVEAELLDRVGGRRTKRVIDVRLAARLRRMHESGNAMLCLEEQALVWRLTPAIRCHLRDQQADVVADLSE